MNKKRKWLVSAICICAATVCFAQQQPTDWARFGRYAKQNDLVATPPKVVFMGNSITEGWYRTDSAFFLSNNYAGRGISGQTSSEMLVRFRPDVINLKPQVVAILAGTNDVAQNNGYISQEHIFGNIISMVELAKANGITPILCSIMPAYEFKWRPEIKPAEKIIELNTWLKAYAEKNNIVYVDYHSALADERGGLPEKFADDGVHPNPEAYKIMEALVQEGIRKVLK